LHARRAERKQGALRLKSGTVKRFGLAALAVALVIAALAAVVQPTARDRLVAQLMQKAVALTVPAPQSLFGKDQLRVLLLGIDYDYTDRDMPYSSHARSDTIMVAALDLRDKQLRLVSVPRDMEAYFDGHDQKINAAYANGGIREADRVIGAWLGLPQVAPGRYFDRYIVLRIGAAKDLIDAIGGVDVVADETMNYDDNWGHLHIHFVGGKLYHMNGDQAVSYMRFRHDACSDPCRIKRQQQVIRLVLAKLERDKFNDVVHLKGLIDATRRDVDTNFKPEELLSLANAYADFDLSGLTATQIPFVGDRETAYAGDMLLADQAAKAKIVASMLESQAPVDAAQIDPSKVRIRVENGSGVPGLAATLAAALRKQGFVISAVANADRFTYTTTVIRLAASAPPGTDRVLQRDLNLSNAQVLADDTAQTRHDVTIIVGKDYAASSAAGPEKS
jgi:LCP family protein required for cell wall assembly